MFDDVELQKKYDRLKEIIAGYGDVAIAFSGGVDSTLLLHAAVDAGGGRVIAVTATPQFVPGREKAEASGFCRERGIEQVILKVDGLSIPGFAGNPPDRCYICKKALFTAMMDAAAERGIEKIAEGSNLDDQGDYRPGLRALAELKILSPLKDAGLTKQDIRGISRELGLATADKPSFACLASRFVYGEEITAAKLLMVEKAEDLLLGLGFRQLRVRIHGEDLARIEVLPEDFAGLMYQRERIASELRAIGFRYVTLDLVGYRTGSMNEAIGK